MIEPVLTCPECARPRRDNRNITRCSWSTGNHPPCGETTGRFASNLFWPAAGRVSEET